MDLIASIRRNHGLDLTSTSGNSEAGVAVQNLQSSLANALHNLSEELYTKDTHFVMEFVQNADDNSYADDILGTVHGPALRFTLNTRKRTIAICCNEEGFSEANVRAICSVGASTKSRQEGYIGEKGIGFKSVFTIARTVSVFSGPYSFRFDTSQHLGIIAPIWLSDDERRAMTAEFGDDARGTTFVLEILPSVDIAELSGKLKMFDASLLLFLRKLRHLSFSIDEMEFMCTRADSVNGRVTLSSGDNYQEYYVVKHIVTTSPEEFKRPNISTSEMILAFPLQENGEPFIEQQNVHAFLPLRSYGFSFIIQADFLTTSNREDILVNRPWNIVLRDAISVAFGSAAQHFTSLPEMRFNWIQYIPQYVSDTFMQRVAAAIKESVYLLDADGRENKAKQLVIVPSEYRMPDGAPLIPGNHLDHGYFYLAHEYNTSRDAAILTYLGVRTMTQTMFLSSLETMDRHGKLSGQTATWFERTSAVLLDLLPAASSKLLLKIRGIKLILIDGTKSRVSADTKNVFFGVGLGDIPSDIQLKIVHQSISEDSSQYALFWALGIRVADPDRVVGLILEKHNNNKGKPLRNALPEHARFLFQHATSTRKLASIKVLCSDQNARLATEVYMDWPWPDLPAGLKLSSLFSQRNSQAAFLHPSYYRLPPDGWFDWLHGTLSINIYPRIIYRTLSPEFSHFVSSNAGSNKFLDALHFYWPHIEDKIPRDCEAAQDLSNAPVRCKDGLLRPLRSTFVPVQALRQFKNLPFLALPRGDPEDVSWRFLARLGASFNVDSIFYLKRLEEFSRQERTADVAGEVAELYAQISARFDDNNPSAIQEAFREQRLVFAPARFASSYKSLWVSWDKICWSGPRSVTQSRFILSSMDLYRPLEKFFRHQLSCPDCPPDILLQEMQLLTRSLKGKALDEADHQRVFNVLRGLDDVIKRRQRTGETIPWLENLRQLSMYPGEMPKGHIELYDISKIYNPYGDPGLAALFSDSVPLLAAPPGYGLEVLQGLLQSDVSRGLRTLTESVTMHVNSSEQRLDPKSSKFYSSRFEFLKRLSLTQSGSNSPLVDLCNVSVYQVDDISRDHKLSPDNIVKKSACTAAVVRGGEPGAPLLKILRCGVHSQESLDLDVAQEVARFLDLNAMFIYTLLTPQLPRAELERMMQKEHIKELAEIAQEVGDVVRGREETGFSAENDATIDTPQNVLESAQLGSSAAPSIKMEQNQLQRKQKSSADMLRTISVSSPQASNANSGGRMQGQARVGGVSPELEPKTGPRQAFEAKVESTHLPSGTVVVTNRDATVDAKESESASGWHTVTSKSQHKRLPLQDSSAVRTEPKRNQWAQLDQMSPADGPETDMLDTINELRQTLRSENSNANGTVLPTNYATAKGRPEVKANFIPGLSSQAAASAVRTVRNQSQAQMKQVSAERMSNAEIRDILSELEPKMHDSDLPGINKVLSTNFRHLEGSTKDASHMPIALHLLEAGGYAGSSDTSYVQGSSDCSTEEYLMGVIGERAVYELLSRELPNFSESNWTSELRHLVPHFMPYTDVSLADFVYSDTTGKLTEIIFKGQKRLIDGWRNRWPTFYLEVKSTITGDKHTPFAFKRQQLLMASKMAIRDLDNPPPEVYVLLRVWNMPSGGVRFETYPDPHTMIYNGQLQAVSSDLFFEICT